MPSDHKTVNVTYRKMAHTYTHGGGADIQMDQFAGIIRSDTGNAAINRNRIQKTHLQSTVMMSHMT